MARVSGSTRVVLAALAGNLGVAAVKLAAFAVTRSTAMLSEGVHSLVDTADQLLLLIGQRRAAKPADDSHPFGYGMEMYFWSFIVALLIFFAGGAVAVWEGVQRLLHPAPIDRPWVSLAVLAASAVFEGFSLRTAYREYREIVSGIEVSVFRFIQISKDPSVFATLLEDGAALVGLSLAALGTLAAWLLGLAWADGAASVAIGVLLLGMAAVLTNETRSLIAGEAAATPIQDRLRAAAEKVLGPGSLRKLTTLQNGPRGILVFVSADFPPTASTAETRKTAQRLVRALKAADRRVSHVAFGAPT